MIASKRIMLIIVFLITVFVQAQDEKLPSYFSNSTSLNLEQTVLSTNEELKLTANKAKLSTISLKQIGDENIAVINNKQALGTQTVYQIGNENNYKFLNYNNNMTINLGIIQTGNANSLNIVGTNSMFKNLKITQFGGAKMEILNY